MVKYINHPVRKIERNPTTWTCTKRKVKIRKFLRVRVTDTEGDWPQRLHYYRPLSSHQKYHARKVYFSQFIPQSVHNPSSVQCLYSIPHNLKAVLFILSAITGLEIFVVLFFLSEFSTTLSFVCENIGFVSLMLLLL